MKRSLVATLLVALAATACGGSAPTTPKPPIVNPPTNPPANTAPTIEGIAVKGRRAGQPANFADIKETVDVTATVTDPETPLEELVYQWTTTVGTITGTGRAVTWIAPDTVAAPTKVTITLKVVENYGHPGQAKIFSHERTSNVTMNLHDSAKEVGDMSRQFLLDFSNTSLKDWQVVMRNFNRAACPVPREYDDERDQVINHYTNFTMHNHEVGPASVSLNFGGTCPEGLPGDACASVRVFWDSTGPTGRGSTRGTDLLTAVYAPADSRWWLCSSRYAPDTTFSSSFYVGR